MKIIARPKYLRNISRDIRKVVRGSNCEAVLSLLISRSGAVDDLVAFGDDGISLKVGHSWQVRMCGSAVIALIVVVGEDLPVVWSFHLPHVVEHVVVEVEHLVALLLINALEVVLPGNFGLCFGIEVDPNEAVDVDVYMDWE